MKISFFGLLTQSGSETGNFSPDGYTRDQLVAALKTLGYTLSDEHLDILFALFDLDGNSILKQEEVERLFPALAGASGLDPFSNLVELEQLLKMWEGYGKQLTGFRFCGISLYQLFSASGKNFAESGRDFFCLTQEELAEALRSLGLDRSLSEASGGYDFDSVVLPVLFQNLKGPPTGLDKNMKPIGSVVDLQSLLSVFEKMESDSHSRRSLQGYPVPGFSLSGSSESNLTIAALGAWIGQKIYEAIGLQIFDLWQGPNNSLFSKSRDELVKACERMNN